MWFHFSDQMYNMVEFNRAFVAPANFIAKSAQNFHGSPLNPLSYTDAGRTVAALYEVFERTTRNYTKPEFGLDSTQVKNKTVAIKEKRINKATFCDLIHFEKQDKSLKQPKLLIVAPLSGHFCTLLRGTVEATLPHYDVYITDWENARDIPISKGAFGLDDYIDYVTRYIKKLGPDVHVMGVCQPSVPVLAAVALLAEEKAKEQPKSMILIGGPIDTRESPTQVNHTAEYRPIEWFERHVITRVPFNYPGFMRRVYPGFIQLAGFMSMNFDMHMGSHFNFFQHLVEGDGDSAQKHKKFYNEYLSVMDLPAEFYLETIQAVFKDHALPKGELMVKGKKVEPWKIKKTALMCIEGELDDISGIGQTKAAIKLCSGLPKEKTTYHMQKGVGHYGTFNGSKFRKFILPEIVKFTSKHS